MPDEEVAALAFQAQEEKTGRDFLPLYLQRVVAISFLMRTATKTHVWSLAEPELGEREIVGRFFDGLEKIIPNLVSWNGSAFDLPVLHHRALLHGLVARRYWETGENDRDFRYDNYQSRYHTRHTDLMDRLSGYQNRGSAPLDGFSRLCGLPGKLHLDSGQGVWDHFRTGRMDRVVPYCETDVMNLYLLHLRFERMTGELTAEAYRQEIERVEAFLVGGGERWAEFLAKWTNRT
jgi:hypothetical protein